MVTVADFIAVTKPSEETPDGDFRCIGFANGAVLVIRDGAPSPSSTTHCSGSHANPLVVSFAFRARKVCIQRLNDAGSSACMDGISFLESSKSSVWSKRSAKTVGRGCNLGSSRILSSTQVPVGESSGGVTGEWCNAPDVLEWSALDILSRKLEFGDATEGSLRVWMEAVDKLQSSPWAVQLYARRGTGSASKRSTDPRLRRDSDDRVGVFSFFPRMVPIGTENVVRNDAGEELPPMQCRITVPASSKGEHDLTEMESWHEEWWTWMGEGDGRTEAITNTDCNKLLGGWRVAFPHKMEDDRQRRPNGMLG